MTKEDSEKILSAYRIAVEKGYPEISQLLFEVIADAMNGGNTALAYNPAQPSMPDPMLGHWDVLPHYKTIAPPGHNDPATGLQWTVSDQLTKELTV